MVNQNMKVYPKNRAIIRKQEVFLREKGKGDELRYNINLPTRQWILYKFPIAE